MLGFSLVRDVGLGVVSRSGMVAEEEKTRQIQGSFAALRMTSFIALSQDDKLYRAALRMTSFIALRSG
jgi:hypothetical protein